MSEERDIWGEDSPQDLTVAEAAALDGEVFCCDSCGWWCETGDESQDHPGCCVDCHPDEEDG